MRLPWLKALLFPLNRLVKVNPVEALWLVSYMNP